MAPSLSAGPIWLGSGVLYAADLTAGQRFAFGSYTITGDEMVAFARSWDPLPLHTDQAAAAAGPFGGLIASGVQTIAIYQRLAVPALWSRIAVIAGRTLREIQLTRPVRPGMTLTGHAELIEVRPRDNGDATIATRAVLHEAHGGPELFTLVAEVLIAGER